MKIIGAKDEIELLPLPSATMHGDEFPNAAHALLEGHGLIEEAAASAAA